MLSLCIRAARVFGKDFLRQLLATVENITNVKSYMVLFTNWSKKSLISNVPGCAQIVPDFVTIIVCTAAILVGYAYHVVGVFTQTEKGLHERVTISL